MSVLFCLWNCWSAYPICACLFPCIYAFSCCLDQFPQRSLSSSPSGLRPRGFSFPKAGAKVRPSAFPAKLFHIFFRGFFTTRCVSGRKNLEAIGDISIELSVHIPNRPHLGIKSTPYLHREGGALTHKSPPSHDFCTYDSSRSACPFTPSEPIIRPQNPSISCRR